MGSHNQTAASVTCQFSPPESSVIPFVPVAIMLLCTLVAALYLRWRGSGGVRFVKVPTTGCGGLSTQEALVVVAYVVGTAAHVVIKAVQLDRDAPWSRALGTFTLLNLTFVTLPVSRTTIWLRVFAISFERAVAFHRALARWTLVGMWGHFLTMVAAHGSCVFDNSVSSGHPPLYGLAALVLFTVMAGAAVATVRRRWFEAFRGSHYLFIPAYAFAVIHNRLLAVYGLVPLLLYVVDITARLWKRRRPHAAALTAFPGVTRLVVGKPRGFVAAAGQYCFINVPAVSKWEWHPFSLTSSPGSGALAFHAKVQPGDTWTARLAAAAGTGSQRSHGPATTTAYVEGPYGTLSRGLADFELVVLVAGGVGATPLLSIMQTFSSCHTPRVVLLWVAPSSADFMWAAGMMPRASDIHLYASRGTGDVAPLASSTGDMLPAVNFGRPDVSALVKAAIVQCQPDMLSNPMSPSSTQAPPAAVSPPRVAIVACGPPPLVGAARRAAVEHHAEFRQEGFRL